MAISAVDSNRVARRPGGRSARIRRAVFDATLALLVADGYQGLTIEAVAAAAAVNKTTVYRNWPTKGALIQAAAEDRSEHIITTEITGDPHRDVVAFQTSVAENITSPIGRALVLATLNERNDSRVREARADFWRTRFDAARPLVRSAMEDAQSADDAAVDAVIEQLIAPLYLRAFFTDAPLDEAFIERTVRAAVSATVKANPARARRD